MINDIIYIADRIVEKFKGCFDNISYNIDIHERTFTLEIKIIGYKTNKTLYFEIDKEIKSLAEQINYISKEIHNS